MLSQGLFKEHLAEEFDKPLLVGAHFGFVPLKTPRILEEDKRFLPETPHEHFDPVEKSAFIRTYLESNFHTLPHPLAFSYKRSLPKRKLDTYHFHFVGAPGAVAEGVLMRTALSILKEEGRKDIRLNINHLGDKESQSAHERELNSFLRKISGELSPETRESLKGNPFRLFREDSLEMLELRERAPESINSLSYQSRLHFKEVMEFIETMPADFRLAPELVGDRHHVSHTVFSAESETGLEAIGYRYSKLSKLFGLKKEVPFAGLSLFREVKDKAVKLYKSLPKPKFYIIQLGREAKIKTLNLLEDLRQKKIGAYHSLGRDKLASQLNNAEELKVSHLIIIGHKEALDNTATVRNTETRAQDTIPLNLLPQYLENIKL